MKPNRLKQRLANGELPVGHMVLEFGTRGMTKMLQCADLDFVIVDTEHSGFSTAQVADMIAWLKATEIAPIVRVPQIEYHFLAYAGLWSAGSDDPKREERRRGARAIVDAAKYAPMGKRGVIMGNAQTDFLNVNAADFMEYANENTTVICQIESVEGLENLEQIATTPGVDILWVGHFDLTQSMGIPGQFDNLRFLDGLKQVVGTAQRNGLGAGIQPGSLAQAQEWMGLGFNVISYSGDHAVYVSALSEAVSGVRRLSQKRS